MGPTLRRNTVTTRSPAAQQAGSRRVLPSATCSSRGVRPGVVMSTAAVLTASASRSPAAARDPRRLPSRRPPAAWSPAPPRSPAPACWAISAAPTSRAPPNRPPSTRLPRRPVRHAAGETAGASPTRSASWCWPATNSTRCARWACSPGSWPPHCRTARPASRRIWARSSTTCPAQAPAAQPGSRRDRGGQAGPHPRFGGADARGLPAAVGHRADGVHRRAGRQVAGQPAHHRRGDRPGGGHRTI